MSPIIAQIGIYCFIFILLYIEISYNKKLISKGIIISFLWMFLASSRYLSQWMNLGKDVSYSPEIYLEGNSLDRLIFLLLILSALWVLYSRRIDWVVLIKKNIWILFYFGFGLLSILWSDFPYVSFKRLIKAFGNILIALLILTEQKPEKSIGILLRLLSYFILPLSILFIKYYPDYGRSYHMGEPMFHGVTLQKNSLGQFCMISGLFFFWQFLIINKKHKDKIGIRIISIIQLLMIFWLLMISNSITAQIGLVFGFFILLLGNITYVYQQPFRIASYLIVFIFVFLYFQLSFGLTRLIIEGFLDRDMNLTTRVPMWFGLIEMGVHPIIGEGYHSFWLGSRLDIIWSIYGKLNQAHNGYLETYLNLGFIGLFLLLASIISGLLKTLKKSKKDFSVNVFKFTLIIVIVIYNWTEASFHGVNNIWLLFFFAIIDIGQQNQKRIELKIIKRKKIL